MKKFIAIVLTLLVTGICSCTKKQNPEPAAKPWVRYGEVISTKGYAPFNLHLVLPPTQRKVLYRHFVTMERKGDNGEELSVSFYNTRKEAGPDKNLFFYGDHSDENLIYSINFPPGSLSKTRETVYDSAIYLRPGSKVYPVSTFYITEEVWLTFPSPRPLLVPSVPGETITINLSPSY